MTEFTAADGTITNIALFVDEICCRQAIDPKAVGNLAVLVEQNGKGWVDIELSGTVQVQCFNK